MKLKTCISLLCISICMVSVWSCRKDGPVFCNCSPDKIVATVSTYASGLNNPRGLKFGPDGLLYVAEGGIGGNNTSTGCDQVVPPIGPYTGSADGARIL